MQNSRLKKNRTETLFRCSSRVATIYSLAFSPDSMFLAASSNTETIHIFRLANPKEK
jgi:WD40 repeat protein